MKTSLLEGMQFLNGIEKRLINLAILLLCITACSSGKSINSKKGDVACGKPQSSSQSLVTFKSEAKAYKADTKEFHSNNNIRYSGSPANYKDIYYYTLSGTASKLNRDSEGYFDFGGSSIPIESNDVKSLAVTFDRAILRTFSKDTADNDAKNYLIEKDKIINQGTATISIDANGNPVISGNVSIPANDTVSIYLFIPDLVSIHDFYLKNHSNRDWSVFYSTFFDNIDQYYSEGYRFGWYLTIKNIDTSDFCNEFKNKMKLEFNGDVFVNSSNSNPPLLGAKSASIDYVNDYLDSHDSHFSSSELRSILVPNDITNDKVINISPLLLNNYTDYKYLIYSTDSTGKINLPIYQNSIDQLVPIYIKLDRNQTPLLLQNIAWNDDGLEINSDAWFYVRYNPVETITSTSSCTNNARVFEIGFDYSITNNNLQNIQNYFTVSNPLEKYLFNPVLTTSSSVLNAEVQAEKYFNSSFSYDLLPTMTELSFFLENSNSAYSSGFKDFLSPVISSSVNSLLYNKSNPINRIFIAGIYQFINKSGPAEYSMVFSRYCN